MDAVEYTKFVRGKATENFNRDGCLTPVILALQGKGLVIATLSRLSKDEAARLLKRMRLESTLVAVLAEAWLVDLANATPEQQRQAMAVQPSRHPARREVAMLTVYHGLTMVVHTADIIRSGGKKKPVLGPWQTMPMTEAEGRLVEPPPEWN
jgi:hypothetical protein